MILTLPLLNLNSQTKQTKTTKKMKGTINRTKTVINLEDGTEVKINKGETAADFIARVKKFVKDERLDTLDLSVLKESSNVKEEEPAAPETEKPEGKGEETAMTLSEKLKAKAMEAVEKARAKALAAQEKAKEAEKEAESLAQKMEERVAELGAKGEEMVKEAEAKAAQMVKDAEAKGAKLVERAKSEVARMLGGGGLVDAALVSEAKEWKGKTVSFKPTTKSDWVEGTVIGYQADKRTDSVFLRIEYGDGKVTRKKLGSENVKEA